MSCTCSTKDRSHWRVVMRNCRRGAFCGGRMTYSPLSLVHCLACGHFWRTKAHYVALLSDATYKEIAQS